MIGTTEENNDAYCLLIDTKSVYCFGQTILNELECNLPVANSACTSRLKCPLVKENPLAASPTSVAVVQ